MPLRLLPLRLADFDILLKHGVDSFPGDDLVAPPNPVAWPVQTPLEAQTRLEFCMALQRKRLLEDPTCHFLKVVELETENSDEDTADIVSLARWHEYPRGYRYSDEAHWELAAFPGAMSEWPTQFNVKAHDFILTQRDSFRERWIVPDKPAWLLMHLVTRPSRRGKGAAALLIRWGQEQAARQNAVAYLESGKAAKPLYERHGFRQVGEVRLLDLRPVGLDLEFQLTNMKWDVGDREAAESSATGLR